VGQTAGSRIVRFGQKRSSALFASASFSVGLPAIALLVLQARFQIGTMAAVISLKVLNLPNYGSR